MLKFHQRELLDSLTINSPIGWQPNQHLHMEVNMMNWLKYIVSFLMIMVSYYIVSQHYPDLFFAVFLGFFGWKLFMSTTNEVIA